MPLLMLLPFGWWLLREGWRASDKRVQAFAGIWFASFLYGLFIAVAHGAKAAGLFGVAEFCLPVAMAMWFATRPEGVERAYERVAYFMLACAAVSSAYGIIQYISPPPWDVQWQLNTDASSFGEPLPFQIRVYSTLNSPGTFGSFLALVMIMVLPLLRARKTWVTISLVLCVAALALSLVRSAWLALVLGIVVYALLTPLRVRLLATLAGFSILVVCAGMLAFALMPNDDARETLSDRFSTLFDLQDDGSAADRRQSTEVAVEDGMANPFGAGVGTTGVGARLMTNSGDISGGAAIDNGFASRLVEMGYPGLAGFLVVTLGSLLFSFSAWRRATAQKKSGPGELLAAATAVQIALLGMEASGDTYQGLSGVFFWTTVALVSTLATQASRARRVSVRLKNVTA
ncbi:MAG TPA: O-antigen ligase family protein [Candidatus Acidoferrales bacterium]|nr:O-antigen ligase family protein [Candidatus Acidoferrales bacterium]